jgi:hypothetical protein
MGWRIAASLTVEIGGYAMVGESAPPGVAPEFLQKLEFARSGVRVVAYLGIVGGVFALMFMLLLALQLGYLVLNMAHVSFLVGGAICFAIGMGLLNYAEPARQAGSVSMLAWGTVSLIVGLIVTWQGEVMIGVFCILGGLFQVAFAVLLRLPAAVFVCAYAGGELTALTIREGILKGQEDPHHPGMAEFVAQATVASPVAKPADDDQPR